MDQATVNVSEILESEKLAAEDIERIRLAAFASEESWRDLKQATAAPVAKGASLARRVKRAAALLALGRPQTAVRELEEAKASQDPVGALVLGRAYLELKDAKRALDTFESGLKKAKGDFDLTMGVIEARREGGDTEAALKEAEALDKKLGDKAEMVYQHAASLEAVGQYDRAMDRYEDVLEREATHARALFRLAYNHELRGSQELAEDYYKRCAALNPTYPNALVNYGLMLEDLNRYNDAIDIYHRILTVRPNHARARLFLKDAEASLDMYYDEDQEKKSDRRNAILRIPVTDFELSVRARNCLNKMNIRNLGDLVTKTEDELLAYKNFGETSLQEIKQMLAQKGLRLGMFREGVAVAPVAGAEPAPRAGDEETLKKPISELELSVRSRNCMERLNVRSIGDLTAKTEADLLAVKNFGQTSLNEIKQRLGELGLSLRSEGRAPDAAGVLGGIPPAAAAADDDLAGVVDFGPAGASFGRREELEDTDTDDLAEPGLLPDADEADAE
jgi:DNA-directed RNA polymerase subunit alpha